MQLCARSSQPSGFDFTAHIRRLCVDIAQRLPELAHVEPARVAIRYCQTRSAARYGVQASLTPLRFQQGARTQCRRGRIWAIERVLDPQGREMLYLLSFYLPRFLDLPFTEKLSTVIHELWHISPSFDGDLRRHAGRCYAHSTSRRQYDILMDCLAEKWLSRQPPPEVYEFLRLRFRTLERRHGPVFGTRIRTPKLIPVSDRAAS